MDKKDYAEATKIFESAYNTNVVVKQKSDMSKNQKIEYAMVKGGVDQLLGLFNIFNSQTANPCQYNCPGISYVNLTGDLSGMEGALTNSATNAKFSIGLPDFISSVKEKGKEIKDKIAGGKEQVATDLNGNTHKVKIDADDFRSEISKSNSNGGSGKNEILKLAPNDGKHQGTTKGDISADPFWNNQTEGEKSLNSAYSDSKTKQLYNVSDGKLVKFQPDNAGGWHAYELQTPWSEVPPYKKWIKNKN